MTQSFPTRPSSYPLRRQDGIHAAAVVITDLPLTEYLPVQRKPEAGQDPELAPMVTQYEMHGVEDLGLLKMDFLGLRNLSVIENRSEEHTSELQSLMRISYAVLCLQKKTKKH